MKLVVSLITSLALVSPALACPNMDHDQGEAPKTADKAPAKAKEQPKTDAKDKDTKDKPAADTAKAKSGDKKPGDKVSLK